MGPIVIRCTSDGTFSHWLDSLSHSVGGGVDFDVAENALDFAGKQ